MIENKNNERPGRGDSFRYTGVGGSVRFVCIDCRYVGHQRHCPTCNSKTRELGPVARPPKKNAHKSKWEEFDKHVGKGYCYYPIDK